MSTEFQYDDRTIDADVKNTLGVARKRGTAVTYRMNDVLIFVATGRMADVVAQSVKGLDDLATKVDDHLVVVNTESSRPLIVGDYLRTEEDAVLYTDTRDGLAGQAPYDCVDVIPAYEARARGAVWA